MTIRRGRYRESIAVDEPTETQDSTGDPIVAWIERAIVRAELQPLRGRERLQGNAIDANIDAKVFTAWAPFWDGVTAKWRIRHLNKGGTTEDGKAGVPYNIAEPPTNVDMRNHEVELMVNTGQNEG
jgi:SPP1 family predicted phage head-tail adaptor